MGFHHHDGGHGRVFRGLKKGNVRTAPIHYKRQNGDDKSSDDMLVQRPGRDRPVMRIPEGFPPELAQKAQDSNYDVETVYENVVVTMPKTFEGEPQFFTTLPPATSTSAARSEAQTTSAADNSRKGNDDNDDDEQSPSRKAASQSTPTSSASAESTASSAAMTDKDEASATSSSAEVTSSSITTGDGTSVHGAMLADNTSSMMDATAIGATHSASPSAEPEKSGMNGGAKAGLAMGIIFGLALVGGIIFFVWRRKKSQQGLEAYNEKSGAAATAAATPPPQVNRFSSDSLADRRTSTQTPATAPRLSLRPVTQLFPNLTGDNRKSIGNIFGAGAISTDKQEQQTPAQNPFGDAAVLSEKQANSPGSSEKSHDRAPSVNSEASVPATPASAQFATAAAVPVPRGPNNVHRVQLDFKPSMEDELELKSGQLVRMLHEYDDGWVSVLILFPYPSNPLTKPPRLSVPVWTAAIRVSSLAHVFPKCLSSLAARHLKTVLRPVDRTPHPLPRLV